jgi:prepilin-type N-terminal cleavage/methylation domain-containing protein
MANQERGLRQRLQDNSGMGLIEVLASLIIMSVGMLAIAGISLQVGAQNRWSTWQTDQALAAQQVMERLQRIGYAAVSSGTDTISVGNRRYVVNRVVGQPAPRVKRVQLTVLSSQGAVPRTFVSRIYENRPLPTSP